MQSKIGFCWEDLFSSTLLNSFDGNADLDLLWENFLLLLCWGDTFWLSYTGNFLL